MNTNNENSRMSRILDHNIYRNTDNLYEPLRNALRKSTVSPNFLSPQHYIADNRMTASRVAKNRRSLSPAETEIIKKNILIPINKELVPTRNLQKVIGKQFVTVDMEERVGEAISPAEFSRVKTGTVEEIVYQIKEDQPPFQSIYTNSARTNAQPFPQMLQSHFRTSTPQIISHSPPIYLSQAQPTHQAQAVFKSQANFVGEKMNQSQRSAQSTSQTPNFNNVLRQSTGVNQPQARNYQNSTLPTVTSQQFIKEPTLPLSNRKTLQNKPSFESGRSGENVVVKAYDFRQSTASKEDSFLRARRDRDEYKYNLFSLIDEGGNNGCQNGCFGSNQVCAPKISSNPWK